MSLYLILHKVRGEPAFDIAEKIEIGDEEGWVIPTSGHRAYPVAHYSLQQFIDSGQIDDLEPMPDDLPDHYQIHDEVKRYGGRVSELLAKLHLRPRYSNLKIRPL